MEGPAARLHTRGPVQTDGVTDEVREGRMEQIPLLTELLHLLPPFLVLRSFPRFLRTPSEMSSVPVVMGDSREVEARHIYCDLYLHFSNVTVWISREDRTCPSWDSKLDI